MHRIAAQCTNSDRIVGLDPAALVEAGLGNVLPTRRATPAASRLPTRGRTSASYKTTSATELLDTLCIIPELQAVGSKTSGT